jgi:hypothetical protein
MIRDTLTAVLLACLVASTATEVRAESAKAVKITVLSSMLAGNARAGIGEWALPPSSKWTVSGC